MQAKHVHVYCTAHMESTCCSCSHSIDDITSKKKQKKLCGASCCVARGVLDRLTLELLGQGSSQGLVEVKGPSALLCHLCDGKLSNIVRHEEQLKVLKAEVISSLKSALHLSSTERKILEPQTAGQKEAVIVALVYQP